MLFGCQFDEHSIHHTPIAIPEVVSFGTIDDYEKVMSSGTEDLQYFIQQQANAGFVSYSAAYLNDDYELVDRTSRNEEPLITDPVMAELVNADGVIRVGDWYFRLNVGEEAVYALHQDHAADYADLVAENLDNEFVLPFSINDEVLTEITFYDGKTTAQARQECSGAPGNIITDNRYVSGGLGIRQNDTFLRYYRYGIGFALYVQVKWQYSQNNVLDPWRAHKAEDVYTRYRVGYEVKCGARSGVEFPAATLQTTRQTAPKSSYTYDFYRAGKKLSRYRAEAEVFYTTKRCNGCSTNINSSTTQMQIRYGQ
ncbi:MAG TPA: hypothetical protein DCR93_26550 [Cytophagales bacterium]|nr:hypothetical protein [Cytophagales bacterium]HAP62906.1 hypothetical protein [Cytophagales bacterium]